jgi:hypothetical protein
MELHRIIAIDRDKYNLSLQDSPLDYFAKAMDFVLTYYSEDFNRIASTKFDDVSPEFFFREYVWVVKVSGFNAKIISRIFPRLLVCYQPLFDMIVGKVDALNSIDIGINAMNVFNNKRKTKAVIDTAFVLRDGIRKYGWEKYRDSELNTPEKLEKLPFIGGITKFHLARNCGLLHYVKPDLHLVRMSKVWGFISPIELCKAIQQRYDMPLGLIDLVLFYSASTFGSK